MINNSLFQKISDSNSRILLITKYWSKEETDKILKECYGNFPKTIFGIGENRIDNIIKKNIVREKMHFIGQIQSKKIEKIITFCSTIHSLDNLKHAFLINKFSKNFGINTKVFLQLNIDSSKKTGIKVEDFNDFLEGVKVFENIDIIGISGMGAGIFTVQEKQKEFDILKEVRDKYLPGKLISAGTSRDYEIALKNKIEVIRIGSKIIL